MATIKEGLTKYERLINDVKKAKDQINNSVVRGGGYISNTLAEIPSSINNMLWNYKKTAIMDLNREVILSPKVGDTSPTKDTFYLDVNFTPRIVVLDFTINSAEGNYNYGSLTIKNGATLYNITGDRNWSVEASLTMYPTEKKLDFNLYTYSDVYSKLKIKFTKVIVLE